MTEAGGSGGRSPQPTTRRPNFVTRWQLMARSVSNAECAMLIRTIDATVHSKVVHLQVGHQHGPKSTHIGLLHAARSM